MSDARYRSPLTPQDRGRMDGAKEKKLKQGKAHIDATLDLHGKTIAAAHGIFTAFVEKAVLEGRRNLLIITGKGRPESETTLKKLLPEWVNAPHIRPYIMALKQAAPNHGGSGAFYVLLKRHNSGK